MFLTLVETVSYLPAVGEPDKSVNNEVIVNKTVYFTIDDGAVVYVNGKEAGR